MANTGITIPDDMMKDIDDRRHATVDRSQWLRDAGRVRLALEDAGRWPPDDLDVDLEEEAGESTD